MNTNEQQQNYKKTLKKLAQAIKINKYEEKWSVRCLWKLIQFVILIPLFFYILVFRVLLLNKTLFNGFNNLFMCRHAAFGRRFDLLLTLFPYMQFSCFSSLFTVS